MDSQIGEPLKEGDSRKREQGEERGELASQLLVDWYLNAVQALVDTAGSKEATNLLFHYFRNAESAALLIIMKAFGLSSINRITYGFISGVTFNFISRAPILNTRIFERGGITTLSGCPFENGPDVNCAVFCEKGSKVYEEVLAIPYQSNLVTCAARGDRECKFIARPVGCQDPRDESDLGQEVAGILNWQLPQEMVDDFSVQYLAEFWILATKALIDHLGAERVSAILAPYMLHRGISFGLKGSSPPGEGGSGLARISAHIDLCERALRMEPSSSITDVGTVERTIMDCPFKEAPVQVCHQFESFCNGICEALDPEYEFSYDRKMTEGASECHWTIRRKSSPWAESRLKVAGVNKDAMRALAWKYAQGEITKKEYDDLRKTLDY